MRTVEDRLRSKIEEQPDGCWLWTGYKDEAGYGRIQIDRRAVNAHRVAYELWSGAIPDGLTLDHLCRNRACVNPAHLEPVTQRENTLRGTSFAAVNAKKTHCLRGHELAGENVYINKTSGSRQCRACMRVARERYAAKPEVQERVQAYRTSPRGRELARARNRRYEQRKKGLA